MPAWCWIAFVITFFVVIVAGRYCYGEQTDALNALLFSFFSFVFSIGALFLFFSTLEARGFVRKFVVAANRGLIFRIESHYRMKGKQFLTTEKEEINKLCLYICERHLVSTLIMALAPWSLVPELEEVPLIFITIKPPGLISKKRGVIEKQAMRQSKGVWCEVAWRGNSRAVTRQIVHHVGHVLLGITNRYDEEEQDEIMRNARLESLLMRMRATEKKDRVKDRRFLK